MPRFNNESNQPMDTPPTPRRLDPRQASSYLKSVHGVNFAPATLAKMRCIGGGPPFKKCGRLPTYEASDLDAYVEGRLTQKVTSTAALPTRHISKPLGRPRKIRLPETQAAE